MAAMPPADAHQFTDLIRQHRGLIHKVAHAYCRHAADREDVVQEIAVQLWRSWGRYDARFKMTTWIYRIALNVAISFYRRERRHGDRRRGIEDHLIAITDPTHSEPGEDVQQLLDCIADLDAVNKALVLLYLDGNDHGSIAAVLGISVSNVGTKLSRIKTKLRAKFDERTLSQPTEEPDATR